MKREFELLDWKRDVYGCVWLPNDTEEKGYRCYRGIVSLVFAILVLGYLLGW